jgi:hypothetical protein
MSWLCCQKEFFKFFQVVEGEEGTEERDCIYNLSRSLISVRFGWNSSHHRNIITPDIFNLIRTGPMSWHVLTTNWEDISVGSQDVANRNQDTFFGNFQLLYQSIGGIRTSASARYVSIFARKQLEDGRISVLRLKFSTSRRLSHNKTCSIGLETSHLHRKAAQKWGCHL